MRIQRSRRPVSTRPRLLIACEGRETEPNYFDGLRQEPAVRDRFDVKVVPGSGGDARTIVSAAIKARKKADDMGDSFSVVWCVLDVEGAANADILRDALERAKREGFHVALSNPSFEVWLIAHFERTTRPFDDSAKAEAHLSKAHWHNLCGRGYDKGDAELYVLLKDRIETAIERSEWVLSQCVPEPDCLNCNSSTEVYSLARRLRSGIS